VNFPHGLDRQVTHLIGGIVCQIGQPLHIELLEPEITASVDRQLGGGHVDDVRQFDVEFLQHFPGLNLHSGAPLQHPPCIKGTYIGQNDPGCSRGRCRRLLKRIGQTTPLEALIKVFGGFQGTRLNTTAASSSSFCGPHSFPPCFLGGSRGVSLPKGPDGLQDSYQAFIKIFLSRSNSGSLDPSPSAVFGPFRGSP